MSKFRLEELPEEILAHIACSTDAETILRLSETCRALRSACYNNVVLKSIITDSQLRLWKSGRLNINALSSQLGKDVGLWACFALADQRAWALHTKVYRVAPKHNVAGSIAVAGHPFDAGMVYLESVPTSYWTPEIAFCCCLSVLSASDEGLQRWQRLLDIVEPAVRDNGIAHDSQQLRAFSTTLSSLKWFLDPRQRSFLSLDNSQAYIKLPTVQDIDMLPLEASYGIPVPYSSHPVHAWHTWYSRHTSCMINSQHFTDAEWVGYYTYDHLHETGLDPPMTGIRFYSAGYSGGVYAASCLDGVGGFALRGTVGDDGRMRLRKTYNTHAEVWDWDCRMTPLGIFGVWGVRPEHTYALDRCGAVWLWKKSWQAS